MGVGGLPLLLLPGGTVWFPDETGDRIDVGRRSAFTVAGSVVGEPVAIGGDTQTPGGDTGGIKVRIDPTSAGGEFGGDENAREERRGISK